jgi:hypothetical protein
MKNLSKNTRYFLLVVGIGVLVMLILGFNNRIATLRRLKKEADVVSTQVGDLEITQASLETQIAHATSEAAVEEWAYQEARMIREGDHPIAPISPNNPTPTPSAVTITTPEPAENWQVWRALFFDLSLP